MHVYASSVVGRWVDVVIRVSHFLVQEVIVQNGLCSHKASDKYQTETKYHKTEDWYIGMKFTRGGGLQRVQHTNHSEILVVYLTYTTNV